MGRRKAGRRVKRRTQKSTDTAADAEDLPPRAFVFTKGKVPASLKALVADMKRVMSPNTAQVRALFPHAQSLFSLSRFLTLALRLFQQSLKAKKRNKLRDFVDVAGALQVSFFLIVSATAKSAYLRLVRTPRGPTLTFKIKNYSLSSDLAASMRRPFTPGNAIWQAAPMLILSNFDKTVQHEALSATMLQNLFPTLNVATARLAAFRRVVLVHQLPEAEGGGAQLRQYVIKAAPTGVSKGVKKLVRASKLPSLGRYADVADFLTGGGGMTSDSGGETDEEEKAELPQDYVGRHAKRSSKVSIKLHEVGPRLSLSLLKVEEGLCDGATLYHSLVSKSEEEVAQTAARVEARKALKAQRKATQAANVQRKQEAEAAKGESRKRRGGGLGAEGQDNDDEEDDDDEEEDDEDEEDDEEDEIDMDAEVEEEDAMYGDGDGGAGAAANDYDDDAEWYRKEVGEEPAAALGLLSAEQKRQKHGRKGKVEASTAPAEYSAGGGKGGGAHAAGGKPKGKNAKRARS